MSDALASLRERITRARAKVTGVPYCPETPSPRQRQFLAIESDDALYGGAAGGGKSSALLMDQLRFVSRSGFAGLILRRTMTDLALPGNIMDRAKQWLLPHAAAGVKWNAVEKVFTFPTDGLPARLQFGYCEADTDVYRYQGSNFHRVGIDELTQWNEIPAKYLKSRIRRGARDAIPLAFRAATNPGGRGHKWVKHDYVDPGDPSRPFVPAKASENPGLDVDAYEKQLAKLDALTRSQLLDGMWVDDTSGLVYSFSRHRNTVQELPAVDGWHAVLAVDLGASEHKPTTAFAISLWHETDPRVLVVRSWAEAGMIPSTIAETVRGVQELYPGVRIVMDIGALGAGYANEMRQRYRLPIEAAEKQNKLGYRKLLNGAFERNEVVLLAPECAMLIDELESLVWDEKGLDNDKTQPNHCTDALLYSWRCAQSWRAAYVKPAENLTEEQQWQRRIIEKHQASKRDPFASW